MSALVAPRPPGLRMREDDDRQGSLFGGDMLQPPARPREDPRGPAEEITRPPAAPRDVAPPAPPREDVAGDEVERGLVVPDDAAQEIRVSRATGRALTGPTLDDAISRAWEGLVAEIPAACPVCHGEIEPVLGGGVQGHCVTCHVTLD